MGGGAGAGLAMILKMLQSIKSLEDVDQVWEWIRCGNGDSVT